MKAFIPFDPLLAQHILPPYSLYLQPWGPIQVSVTQITPEGFFVEVERTPSHPLRVSYLLQARASYTISHYKRSFWPPPQHGAAARLGRAAAPQNTTDSHLETLCIELVLHPPTPYTLSPLEKGGEGRGEGGSYTPMPCPFGALLVTLYYFKSKAFLM